MTSVLGISAFYHDSSATIIKDEKYSKERKITLNSLRFAPRKEKWQNYTKKLIIAEFVKVKI